jgi:acetyl-CoA carboxylase biotin carboxylase subunit
VRIIRACRELGLRSVAVYSEIDRQALHVCMADEAYPIGPAPASQSYLRIPAIIDTALQANAQAIHPGYGFLAENAEFAEACRAAGLIFIGPGAEIQRAVGEKTSARQLAREAGVPIVPGALLDGRSDVEIQILAAEIGYPLLLKAAAGGGGKGIRMVREERGLLAALQTARNEAQSAFGDNRVYVEKAVTPTRHIEIQFFADTYGQVVHLGERECSIQRRHQKLVEEAPSPVLDATLREQMTSATTRLIRSIGYVNAGTAEFLLGPDRQFYFLEINARIQVEHPVTELCTSLDLVQEQLRVAAGLPLSFTQDKVTLRGVAIECRISAEDPAHGFLPASGSIQALQEPSGPGVRVESSLYPGLQIPLVYDPLLAKLIVWAPDRAQAIARMRRALAEYRIVGVNTTLPFARWLMDQPRYQRGDLSTDFIAEEWPLEDPQSGVEPDAGQFPPIQVAALVGALLAEKTGQPEFESEGQNERSRWLQAARLEGINGR